MNISLEFQQMTKRMEKRHYSKRHWLRLFCNCTMPVLRYKETDKGWALNSHTIFRRLADLGAGVCVVLNHNQNRVVIMNRRPWGSGLLNGTPRVSNTIKSWGDFIWVQVTTRKRLAISIHFDSSRNICWTLASSQESHPASGLLPPSSALPCPLILRTPAPL